MPIEKPKKPTELIPRAFGGIKNNFSDDLQSTGFEPNIPQTYNGDNLNYHLDATGKELDYVEKVVDFINQAPVNHVPFVNENNQLDYVNKDELGGGGLEIGDVAFTQMAIDETKGKRRVLNGQLIIQEQYAQFTKIIKDSVALNSDLACTEAEWQTELTMSTNGVCYKYVIDDEAGTIRLPKYPNYFIGGVNNIAPVVGNGMTLGMTNGSSNFALTSSSASPFQVQGFTNIYNTSVGTEATGNSLATKVGYGVTTDPTKSGIEAQISQEQIKGTYFIQVATGAETEDNIINEIELNNPFSLLDYKYSEYELNNLSWLRSEGQYNSKAIYPAVYDLLLRIYNGTETKAGVSVKLSTETYTDYDFVLNTAEETFRLPVKVKLASGKAVVGTEYGLGLTSIYTADNSTSAYLAEAGSGDNSKAFFSEHSQTPLPVGSEVAIAQGIANYSVVGVVRNPDFSGIETCDSDLYLYFYVGETVQNANLINAGRIEEKLATVIPDNSSLISGYAMPSDRYIDLTLGASDTTYTAPANGWYVLRMKIKEADKQGSLENQTSGVFSSSNTSIANGFSYTYVPARKRDVVKMFYTGTPNAPIFRFVYAEGEV